MTKVAAPPLRIVLAGHVDHGKSTVVGRLLHDTGALLPARLAELEASAARRGVPFEWSFALDALQAERDQAVTIETTRVWLELGSRKALLIDAPGHREFIAKMVAGAAAAEAALLVVDAAQGIEEQTRRHLHLLHLLGIATLVVAVNKMDLVGFAETRFAALGVALQDCLGAAGLEAGAVVPVAARDGDNLVRASARMPWYRGPTLAECLAALAPSPPPPGLPLRLPIQDVYRIAERRLYVGRIESGRLAVGDEVLLSPSNKRARVQSIELWPDTLAEAQAGRSVALTFDRPLFVERGEVVSHVAAPPLVNRSFRATLAWLSPEPLRVGHRYRLQLGTLEAPVVVEAVERVLDPGLERELDRAELRRDEIGEVVLHSPRLLALDDADRLPRTGRLVLRAHGEVAAGGLARLQGIADLRPAAAATALAPVAHRVTREVRARRSGHLGGVLWFTGLSGSGKSTLAMAVEEHLFRKGYAVYVLDGDNVRSGLNADLGFGAEARAENIRRVGEVAALFADAGFICVTAFISPFAADRARARAAAGAAFHEIHIAADLATCERRDPKGLYRRARSGEIAEFTGISSAYEPPEAPELVVDTAEESVEASIERIVAYVEQSFRIGE